MVQRVYLGERLSEKCPAYLVIAQIAFDKIVLVPNRYILKQKVWEREKDICFCSTMLATVEYDKGRLLEKSDGQNIDKSKTSQKLSDCFSTLCALRVDQIIVQ